MKHLKTFEKNLNLFSFDQDKDLTIIKEILLELKHEYPGLEGDITTRKFGESEYLIIILTPQEMINEDVVKLASNEKKLSFFTTVIECCKRIQEATDREVRITDLFNTDMKPFEIAIDDIKRKGVHTKTGPWKI